MIHTILLISGKAGSGKDTFFETFRKLQTPKYNIINLKFSSYLKEYAAHKYNYPLFYTESQDCKNNVYVEDVDDDNALLTIRETLIKSGRELKHFDKDIFSNKLIEKITDYEDANKDSHNLYVITDVRFVNEIKKVREFYDNNQQVFAFPPQEIRIDHGQRQIPGISIKDESETELDNYKFYYVIDNTTTLSNYLVNIKKYSDMFNETA